MLSADDEALSGLEKSTELLLDDATGLSTGLRVVRRLGRGGMSTVFLAEREGASSGLSAGTPSRVALKIVQATMLRQLERLGVDPHAFVQKEAIALAKVSGRTKHVVDFYGHGLVDVRIHGESVTLPWIALELVEDGGRGASLEERVVSGISADRALALVRGALDGVAALHSVAVIHRDIKPANVLVADTADGEVAKLSDCGIARLLGMQLATIAAASVRYAAPEQLCSVTNESNPLIGPWTDVHALAALVWFVLGGVDWYEVSEGWERGSRASLRRAPALARRLREDSRLLDRLDGVLARAASMRMPGGIAEAAPPSMAGIVYSKMIASFRGPDRYADVPSFAADLLPLLEEAALPMIGTSPLADTFFLDSVRIASPELEVEELPAPPGEVSVDGAALVQADGKILARIGRRLIYFVDDKPNAVTLLKELVPLVAQTQWIVPGPSGGFALLGPRHFIHFSRGRANLVPLPVRVGEMGAVVSAVTTNGELCIVTAETPASDGGPELHRTRDGVTWDPPERVDVMNGSVRAVASVEGGVVLVGASANGKYDRVAVALRDGARRVCPPAVSELGALEVVAVGPFGEVVAAGAFFVAKITRDERVRVALPNEDAPRAICIDRVGAIYLATSHALLRGGTSGGFEIIHRRDPSLPSYVAIGVTDHGVCAVDAAGGRTRLRLPAQPGAATALA